MELSHKNFKAAIITILNEITVNTTETIGKEYVLREIGIIKKDMENLEQKYSIRNLKKTHTNLTAWAQLQNRYGRGKESVNLKTDTEII